MDDCPIAEELPRIKPAGGPLLANVSAIGVALLWVTDIVPV